MFTQPDDAIHEEPLRLRGASASLHAMFYGPRRTDATCAVVIAAPDGEERSWAERPMVTTARALARSGCSVLRFDFAGQGESDGEYEHTTVETRIADLITACSAIQERTHRMPAVLGVRLGGTIAIAAAASHPHLRELVLWEPIYTPAEYVHQLLRVNLSMQMVMHGRVLRERDALIALARSGELVSVNGFNLSGPFIDELCALDIPGLLGELTARTLMLVDGAVRPPLEVPPHIEVEGIPCSSFWTEPKVHVTTPPAFLARTLPWLRPTSAPTRPDA